ncbi:MAG: hypothetical protein GY832_20620 [Chloroflexi bacterium]|nr:hypothetical protein [Chloroflexota bacterium]
MQSKSLAIRLVPLVIVLLTGCTTGSVKGIDSIHTDNYANNDLEYYYYIPPTIAENSQKPYPVLIMIPGLSEQGEHFVTRKFKRFADAENFIIVAPSFVWDEKNWDSRTSYQYPSAWSGNALLEIINQMEKKTNVTISESYLFGFSAGAQFALRFCVWEPDMCVACAAHGSGGTVTLDRAIDVRFFVTVGNRDTLRIEKAKAFYNCAQDLGIDIDYQEYDTGHSLTSEQIKDSLDFFTGAD